MERRAVLLAAVMLLIVASVVMAASSDDHVTHIRTADPAIRSLVGEAWLRSATFRKLLDTLEASDVVVYIRADPTLPQWLDARTSFVTTATGTRYLEVAFKPNEDVLLTMTLIGHELGHACEVAADASIVDVTSMGTRYLANGDDVRMRGDRTLVETDYAVQIGKQVRRELRPHRSDLIIVASTH